MTSTTPTATGVTATSKGAPFTVPVTLAGVTTYGSCSSGRMQPGSGVSRRTSGAPAVRSPTREADTAYGATGASSTAAWCRPAVATSTITRCPSDARGSVPRYRPSRSSSSGCPSSVTRTLRNGDRASARTCTSPHAIAASSVTGGLASMVTSHGGYHAACRPSSSSSCRMRSRRRDGMHASGWAGRSRPWRTSAAARGEA